MWCFSFQSLTKEGHKLLESVQNNFALKLFLRCRGLNYDGIPSGSDRANMFSLPSLQTRRKRADLVVLIKVLTGMLSLTQLGFLGLF